MIPLEALIPLIPALLGALFASYQIGHSAGAKGAMQRAREASTLLAGMPAGMLNPFRAQAALVSIASGRAAMVGLTRHVEISTHPEFSDFELAQALARSALNIPDGARVSVQIFDEESH